MYDVICPSESQHSSIATTLTSVLGFERPPSGNPTQFAILEGQGATIGHTEGSTAKDDDMPDVFISA